MMLTERALKRLEEINRDRFLSATFCPSSNAILAQAGFAIEKGIKRSPSGRVTKRGEMAVTDAGKKHLSGFPQD